LLHRQLFESLALVARLPPAAATPLTLQLAGGLYTLVKGNHTAFVRQVDHWRTLMHLLTLSIDASPAGRSVLKNLTIK